MGGGGVTCVTHPSPRAGAERDGASGEAGQAAALLPCCRLRCRFRPLHRARPQKTHGQPRYKHAPWVASCSPFSSHLQHLSITHLGNHSQRDLHYCNSTRFGLGFGFILFYVFLNPISSKAALVLLNISRSSGAHALPSLGTTASPSGRRLSSVEHPLFIQIGASGP